jgi:hypothetical protein
MRLKQHHHGWRVFGTVTRVMPDGRGQYDVVSAMVRWLLVLLLLALPASARIVSGPMTNPAQYASDNATLAGFDTRLFPDGVWRSDYAAGNGAPPLFYKPSGSACSLNAGAGDNGSQVASTDGKCWLAVFPSSGLDIREFGADPTGASDSAAALSAAIAAAGANKVLVPEGTFKCNSQISANVPQSGLVLEGKGSAQTALYFPSTDGLALTLATGSRAPPLHIRDFSLLTGGTGASVGITIAQSVAFGTNDNSDITNVTLKGNDGGSATRYWSTGIILNFVSFLNFHGVDVIGPSSNLGTGVSLTANAAIPGIVYNFTSANFQNLATGILVASTWVQGITVGQSNFTSGTNGISIPSGGSSEIQLTLIGNQFGYQTNAAIDVEVAYADVMFHDNLVLAPSGGSGVIIGNATRVSVENNHFVALVSGTGTGINIKSTGGLSLGGIISGNLVNGFGTGINLQASASGFLVTGNLNQGNTTFVSNSGINNAVDGDTVSSTVAIDSAVALTSGVSKSVTSISVPPGNWLITGNVNFNTGASTVVSSIGASISTASNTMGSISSQFPSSATGFASTLATGAAYFGFTTATTVYLVAVSGFTTSIQAAYGTITAVRQLQ